MAAAAEIARRAEAFRKTCRELAKKSDADKRLVFEGRDGWLFLTKELRHVGHGRFWGKDATRNTNLKHPDPLPAIVDLHQQLQTLGVELILAPIPPKAIVYADKVSKTACPLPRLDTVHQAFYAELRKQSVTVVDATQALLGRFAAADLHQAATKTYCQQDSHFSSLGAHLVAGALAAEIKKRAWYKPNPKQGFGYRRTTREIDGNLRRRVVGEPPPKEKLGILFAGRSVDGTIQPLDEDLSSPVLLVGDSHCLVFHVGKVRGEDLLAEGAGLADHLGAQLGFAVDVCASMGSGATAARVQLYRRTRRDPKYLSTKKVIVWCFSATEFTETDPIGWKKLPVQRR
jgi:alginate O-acetyltransferase complex protein AlgJ